MTMTRLAKQNSAPSQKTAPARGRSSRPTITRSSAHVPLELDGKYYYLEGGWPRLPKSSDDDDVPDAEHYYPDAGGR